MKSYIHEIYNESGPSMAGMKSVLHNLYFLVTLALITFHVLISTSQLILLQINEKLFFLQFLITKNFKLSKIGLSILIHVLLITIL